MTEQLAALDAMLARIRQMIDECPPPHDGRERRQ